MPSLPRKPPGFTVALASSWRDPRASSDELRIYRAFSPGLGVTAQSYGREARRSASGLRRFNDRSNDAAHHRLFSSSPSNLEHRAKLRIIRSANERYPFGFGTRR